MRKSTDDKTLGTDGGAMTGSNGATVLSKLKESKLFATPTLAVIAIILALILVLLLFFSLSSNRLEKDKNVIAGSVAGMSMEEIQKSLNDAVEASKASTSVASVVEVDRSTKEAKWLIENPDYNTKDLRATAILNDTGQVIYESGVIKPGFFIPSAPLNTSIDEGIYDCTVTFEVINPDSNMIIGETATQVQLRVNS